MLKDLLTKFENANKHELAFATLDHMRLIFLIRNPLNELSHLQWYKSFDRYLSIMPKSCTDQLLYTRIYKTINKVFEYLDENSIDSPKSTELYNWTFNLINNNTSANEIDQPVQQSNCFLNLFKYFLDNYETDELQIRFYKFTRGKHGIISHLSHAFRCECRKLGKVTFRIKPDQPINQFKKTVNGLCIISFIGPIDPLIRFEK